MCALAEHFSFRSPPVVPSLGFDFEVTGIAHHRVHCHGRAQRLTAPRAPVHDKLVTAVIWHQLGNDILGSGANRDSDVEARLMTTPHLNDNPIGVPRRRSSRRRRPAGNTEIEELAPRSSSCGSHSRTGSGRGCRCRCRMLACVAERGIFRLRRSSGCGSNLTESN